MDPAKLFNLLKELAQQLGVEVRLEALEGGEEYRVQAGLCRLGGRLVAFVDRSAPPGERCRQLGRALLGRDLEAVYLRPAVREYLESLTGGPGRED
ncbi:MAG: hypothetical protein KQJ78_24390 [Deltaproteobacteria bacterium]|nr:hypothetical protein [Deltaproteobacteria bacterium]